MSQECVIYQSHSEEVVSCILNRPEKRNALNTLLMQQLCAHAEQAAKDPKVRIFILRGNGSAFCSGLDFGEAMNPELGLESAEMVKQCLLSIHNIPAVTIAVVQGMALGGGAGLVTACDFALACPDATIGFPEVRRGLVAAQVMTLLIRKLRGTDIRDLILSGEPVNAARALQIGLFHRVGDLEAELPKIVSQLLLAAPGALAKTKQLIEQLDSRSLQNDLEMSLHHHLESKQSAEAQEGIRAFLEKRKPSWVKTRMPSV
jgi:methylglutaconyl-CoA hydratase